MKKLSIVALAAAFGLSACGGSDALEAENAEVSDVETEAEFDQQLSDEEANAALDALDAEEAGSENSE